MYGWARLDLLRIRVWHPNQTASHNVCWWRIRCGRSAGQWCDAIELGENAALGARLGLTHKPAQQPHDVLHCRSGHQMCQSVLMCPWKRVNSNSTNAVYRDAEHFGTESLKFGQEFVVERHLIVTHRALISRVKHENYRPPRKSCKETR